MKQRLKNQNGTTLVELIVCMVLLSLFTLAAVTLIPVSYTHLTLPTKRIVYF